MKLMVVALSLITLHGPTGARIDLNADAITSIRDPHAMPGHWDKGVKCIVLADNSAPITVMETCEEVRAAIGALRP